MTLRLKIAALCLVVFALCGLSVGLLQRGVHARELQWGAGEKAKAAAIAAARFAESDFALAAPERLDAAARRAGLARLQVHRQPTAVDAPLLCLSENADGRLEARYRVSNLLAVAEAENPARAARSWKLPVLWTFVGALFGLATAWATAHLLGRRLGELRRALRGERVGRGAFVVSEFEDLARMGAMLREIVGRKLAAARRPFDAAADARRLQAETLARLAPPMHFKRAGRDVAVAFAHDNDDGAFFAALPDGRFLYGRIETDAVGARRLAQSALARECALAALKTCDAKAAFARVSRLFNCSHWNLLRVCDTFAEREGFESGAWGTERFAGDGDALFSTARLGGALRFYARLNLGAGESRLRALLALSPENEGGLFILVEKSHEIR